MSLKLTDQRAGCYAQGMNERSSRGKKRDHDFAVTAFRVVQETTGQKEAPVEPAEPEPTLGEKNPNAVALGRLGGKKGGKARAAKLTPEQRREIAKKAAAGRWSKRTENA